MTLTPFYVLVSQIEKNSTVLVQISIKLMGVHQNVPIKPHRGPIIYSKEDLLTD